MPVNWKRIVEHQQTYSIEDFQRAALRLLNEQILYQVNPKQRSDYDLIATYENEFAEASAIVICAGAVPNRKGIEFLLSSARISLLRRSTSWLGSRRVIWLVFTSKIISLSKNLSQNCFLHFYCPLLLIISAERHL